MSAYTIALFLHIAGAFGLVAVVGIQIANATWLRQARRVEQVRELVGRMESLARAFPIILLTILAAGLYMAITEWGFKTPWVDVSLVTFLSLAAAGPILHAPRGAAMKRAAEAAPDGPLPPELANLTRDPLLLGSQLTFAWLTLGILFLMTNKPALGGSIVVMLVALLLGLAACIPLRRRQMPDAAHVVRKANITVGATRK